MNISGNIDEVCAQFDILYNKMGWKKPPTPTLAKEVGAVFSNHLVLISQQIGSKVKKSYKRNGN